MLTPTPIPIPPHYTPSQPHSSQLHMCSCLTLHREVRKRIHLGCHLAACLCIALGLVAVLQSHRLSRPVPMPDWYSPHSYLGLTAMTLVGLQVGLWLTYRMCSADLLV